MADRAQRKPQNVVGNRFMFRVSEELKALSVKIKQSTRFSRVPSRKTTSFQHLSEFSSYTSDGRMKSSANNPKFEGTPASTKKKTVDSTLRGILNEVEPGLVVMTSIGATIVNDNDAALKHRFVSVRRLVVCRFLLLLIVIGVIAAIAGIVISKQNSNNVGSVNNQGTSTNNLVPTFQPSASPTLKPTFQPTFQPTFEPTPIFCFLCG